MQCPEILRVQAYFDGEAGALAAAEVERHIDGCAQCRGLLQDLERVRSALRRELPDFRASPALRARISTLLDEESSQRGARRAGATRSTWRRQPFWIGAVSGVGASAMAAALAFVFLGPLFANPLVDELVGAHIRSLMPAHLIDVESTDRHTVKPWFAGHTDVSPVVADFAPQGYRLIGGRADYLDHQRSAVVVYEHGAHVINVFSWIADKHSLPGSTTRNGYHLLFFRAADVEYAVVSDAGWDELRGLARLLSSLGATDVSNGARIQSQDRN